MSEPASDGAGDTIDRLELYADYVCPFCFLGKRSLERYRERRDQPLEVDWQPYDLRRGKRNPDGTIDHDADDGKDDDYFAQARENVRRLQERYDVEMAQELAIEVDSLPAQQVSLHVKREYSDRWASFDEAIYAALWEDGREIDDTDVLADLATDAGLPGDVVTDALEDDGLRATLEERFDDARRQGVTGVPTFVSQGHAARGAVPPEQLEQLVGQ
ncbi:DsbA family oxidoreductase [Halobiforma nitratireducens]|uniref:DSBA oxidoreductase n=1 Tax=Halobiforma nitratireducens JCM 10879 TaxID=1227454 RepID=M0MB79_9EURY|nr:DsbA family protein [Halobiforma nitratireducens]EMA41660.1 DSBA oxidoreductase [Halobiforma nitratireducens JCM 10879]